MSDQGRDWRQLWRRLRQTLQTTMAQSQQPRNARQRQPRATAITQFLFRSLRSRLILLVLLAIVPPLVLTIRSAGKERERTVDAAESNLQRLTYLAANSEAKSIEAGRQFLMALSTLPDLRADPLTCGSALRNLLNRNDGYVNLGLIDLNGDVVCNAVSLPERVYTGDRSPFRRVLTERKFVIGDYAYGPLVRKHAVNLMVPLIDADNRVQGVVFATLDLASLDKFVSDVDLPSRAVMITVDSKGYIIARRPEPEKWIGTRISDSLATVMLKVRFGTSEITGVDGIPRLHAFAPVGGPEISDFTVSIGIPSEDIVATARRAHVTELLTLLAIASLALLAAWFVGEVTIVRRIKVLVRTTDQIAVGNLRARTGLRYGREEISQLARALDQMAASLQQTADERDDAQQKLFAEKERALVTLESIGDGVIATDKFGAIQYMNPVAEQLTGWRNHEAQGLPLEKVFSVVDSRTRAPVLDLLAKALAPAIDDGLDSYLLLSRDGNEYAVEESAAPIRDRTDQVSGIVLVFHDVSESRRQAQQLSYQAAHDALTGLFNRREFERRLQLAIDSATSQERHHTLLFMDLDQFKIVNDTCGHNAGDELLRQITALLQPLLRDSDTLARLGGDEFGVLLENCSADAALVIAQKLRQTVCEFHFVWSDKTFPIGASIGLVQFPLNNLNLEDLLSAADRACYQAKNLGRNQVYMHRLDDVAVEGRHTAVDWLQRLRHALEADRFRLLAQEIQRSGPVPATLRQYELLLRLADEQGELILPGAFLPAAERYQLMPAIDRWMLRTTCARFEQLPKADAQSAATQRLWLTISAASVNDAYFIEFLRDLLLEYQVPAGSLCLQIGESIAITHLAATTRFIAAMQQLGCKTALDDFGSGMSSFSYLKHLAVDYLKIDSNLVNQIDTDQVDQATVAAIVNIGHALRRGVIAKEVGSVELQASLSALGVDAMQGAAIAANHRFS